MAKTVRYRPSVHADGRISQLDVTEALRIRIASPTAADTPRHQRQLTAEQRQQIVERDEGRRQDCGGQGTEIDYIAGPIDGDINHPDNLQLLCTDCDRKKTIAGHRARDRPWAHRQAQEMQRRIRSPAPRRECDDVAAWKDLNSSSCASAATSSKCGWDGWSQGRSRVLRQTRAPTSARSTDIAKSRSVEPSAPRRRRHPGSPAATA